jgi:hypothetical protein
MPFGIRPSNVRVCHSTTRASRLWENGCFPVNGKWRDDARKCFIEPGFLLLLLLVLLIET